MDTKRVRKRKPLRDAPPGSVSMPGDGDLPAEIVKPFVTGVLHVTLMVDQQVLETALIYSARTLRDVAIALQSHIQALRKRGHERVVPLHVRVTEHLSVRLPLPEHLRWRGAPEPEGKVLLTSEPLRASRFYMFGRVISELEARMNWSDMPGHLRGYSKLVILPTGEPVGMSPDMAHFPFNVVDIEDPALAMELEWMPWDAALLQSPDPGEEEVGIEEMSVEEVSAQQVSAAPEQPTGPETSQVIPQMPVEQVWSDARHTMVIVDGCNKIPTADVRYRPGFEAVMRAMQERMAGLGMPDDQIEQSFKPFRPIKISTQEEFAYMQAELAAGRARLPGAVEQAWLERSRS